MRFKVCNLVLAVLALAGCAKGSDPVIVTKDMVESRAIFPATECDVLVFTTCVIRPTVDHKVAVAEARRGFHGGFTSVEFTDDNLSGRSRLMINRIVGGDSARPCDQLDATLCSPVLATAEKSMTESGKRIVTLHVDVLESDANAPPQLLAERTVFLCYHAGPEHILWCGDRLPDCELDPKNGGACNVGFRLARNRAGHL